MKLRTQGKIAIAVVIAAIAAGAIYLLRHFAPEAETGVRIEVLDEVQVIEIAASSPAIMVASQGMVEAPTETNLSAEVGGSVASVAPKFEVGEDFRKGEVLLEIDPADYAATLAQMETNVADAELNLALEEGRARQSERDWKSVGNSEPPPDLVMRKPQMKSAEAKLASAKAALEKARRDLERTKIRAPYDCRIRAIHAEVGSFLAPGKPVADIYELGDFEVRLPVPLDDYAFITGDGEGSKVTFTTSIGGEAKSWTGTIIRDEGVIDRSSRSVYLVAKIAATPGDKYLSPGLFVQASIAGKTLENIVALPREALYGKNLVYIIDADDKLNFRRVEVARTELERVLITSGLEPGERVCTTNLAAAIDKMKVKIHAADAPAATSAEQPLPADTDGAPPARDAGPGI